MLESFIPTKLLGSHNGTCYANFDQTSFIAGASSDNFNAAGFDTLVAPIVGLLSTFFPQPGVDPVAAAVPNPFFGLAPKTYIDSNQTLLRVVDGGEDGEIIPFQPLLVKARGVDVIIAIDAVRCLCRA